MNEQGKTGATHKRTEKYRDVTLALGLLSACIIGLIIFLSFQLRDTLLSKNSQIQNNDLYIQRQMGAEIFRLNRAFERYLNSSGSYTEFIIKYDILYSRVDQLHKTPFFEQTAKRIGYEEVVLSIRSTIRNLDQHLESLESKDQNATQFFRSEMDNVVTQ